jgi:signal transduction histidine kinase/CheY-like chemotaxis protein
MRIADDTGEILLESAQQNILEPGTRVEAVGRPSVKDGSPMLNKARYFSLQQIADSRDSGDRTNKPIFTSGTDIYALDAKDKQEDLIFDAEFRVLFYDPYWKTLWAEDDKSRFYIQPGATPLRLRSGQKVHVRGLFSEPRGLRAQDSDITVLEEQQKTPPADITETISDHSAHNGRFVQVTGYVEKQTRVDQWHEGLQLLVNDRKVNTIILRDDETSFPQLEGAVITAQGLLSYTPPKTLQEETYALMVSSHELLHQLHWLRSDPRFSLPLTPLSDFADLKPNKTVRITGRVSGSVTGHYVDLRDDSGQVRVFSLQSEKLQVGETLEAVGLPETTGIVNTLRRAIFIRSSSTLQKIDPSLSNQSLKLVGQISSLSTSEATRRFPVALRVVVTWSAPSRRDFYGEDGSGGIQFLITSAGTTPPAPGDVVDIQGETDGSIAYPRVRLTSLRPLRSQNPPTPQIVSLDQARTGVGQNTTVEMRAVLRRAVPEGPFQRLEMVCNSGTFQALIPAAAELSRFIGAIVNVRGVSTLDATGLRSPELTLLMLLDNSITLVEEPANQLQSIASQNISSLVLNPPRSRNEKWVRTLGILTYHREGQYLYVQEGNETLRVFTTQPSSFRPGDTLDITGLPAWFGDQLVMREALVRKSKSGPEPKPLEPQRPYRPEHGLENALVTMEGSLVSQLEIEGKTVLTLQDQGRFFIGELWRKPTDFSLSLEEGMLLRLTGIYHINHGEDANSYTLNLELRSPSDLVVVNHPPWLTPERAITVVALLSAVSLLATAWIIQLRRIVDRQTQTIRRQMEKEAQLTSDLERATRLESLGMLAGGIAHDFNNMLTIIVGNLSLARMEMQAESNVASFLHEAERGAMRARNLTQQLLTFARGGNPVRKAEDLTRLLKEEIEDATSNGQLKVTYSLPDKLPAVFVDRSQISQVLHNLVANSIQASATRLLVSARAEEIPAGHASGLKGGRHLRISLLDDGPGVPAENLGKIFDPYFTTHKGRRGLGLSLVRSIVIKHEGYVTVSSEPGSGAEFILWLPVAPETQAPASSLATATQAQQPAATGTLPAATILLMDDEAPIRLMISALLRRLGHKVTMTADGGAAVREYKAAMDANRGFDLVILDLSVPNGMGGMEAMEQLRLMDPKVLAIVSSGYSNDPIMADHASFGFAAMVPKPYQVEELTRTVQQLLQQRAASRS